MATLTIALTMSVDGCGRRPDITHLRFRLVH